MSTVTRAGVELTSVPHRRDSEVTRFEYDQDTASASLAVVAAVSAVAGTGPEEIEVLGEAVDADALDALVCGREARVDSGVQVTLSLERWTVTVESRGVVTVTANEQVGVRSKGVNAG